jgi:hypothetical protein
MENTFFYNFKESINSILFKPEAANLILNTYKNSRALFIVPGFANYDGKTIINIKHDCEKLSLPFQTVWIEKVNKKLQRDVDWSHQWEIRGHWRVCETIGKDRDGIYQVEGYTWVKNHIKGKGILVKKARIFNAHP